MTPPSLATLESQQGFHWTGQGDARRSWMESYAIDCPNCDGLTECICEDDDAGGDCGWADQRLGRLYHEIELVRDSLPQWSTEVGCLNDALKAVELADVHIEKREREA